MKWGQESEIGAEVYIFAHLRTFHSWRRLGQVHELGWMPRWGTRPRCQRSGSLYSRSSCKLHSYSHSKWTVAHFRWFLHQNQVPSRLWFHSDSDQCPLLLLNLPKTRKKKSVDPASQCRVPNWSWMSYTVHLSHNSHFVHACLCQSNNNYYCN